MAVALSRSQSVILKRGANIKYLPYVFTEHGAIMAANVLNSAHAVRMGVYVVRAFIRLRHTVALQKEIMIKLDELERKVTAHDSNIKTLFATVRQLMAPAGAEETKDWIFGKRKGRGLRTAVVAVHFDVLRILKTWNRSRKVSSDNDLNGLTGAQRLNDLNGP